MLAVRSAPAGAAVRVDGTYRGETPLDLELRPGRSYAVKVQRAGFEPAVDEVAIRSGETAELRLDLVMQEGDVHVNAFPPDAELLIDGETRGIASQTVRLHAVPHTIEVRKDGYEPYRQQVTPLPGILKSLDVKLTNREEVARKAAPPVVETSEGHTLQMIQPGRFVMGASRREPGRRANEALHEVELTRRFYLATREGLESSISPFQDRSSIGTVGRPEPRDRPSSGGPCPLGGRG